MTRAGPDIASTVLAIIAKQAGLEAGQVAPQDLLPDLGLDSLGLVEVIFALEESFDIAIPFNANAPEASPFDTASVAAVILMVETLVAGKRA